MIIFVNISHKSFYERWGDPVLFYSVGVNFHLRAPPPLHHPHRSLIG
jgi:hypothetical protein